MSWRFSIGTPASLAMGTALVVGTACGGPPQQQLAFNDDLCAALDERTAATGDDATNMVTVTCASLGLWKHDYSEAVTTTVSMDAVLWAHEQCEDGCSAWIHRRCVDLGAEVGECDIAVDCQTFGTVERCSAGWPRDPDVMGLLQYQRPHVGDHTKFNRLYVYYAGHSELMAFGYFRDASIVASGCGEPPVDRSGFLTYHPSLPLVAGAYLFEEQDSNCAAGSITWVVEGTDEDGRVDCVAWGPEASGVEGCEDIATWTKIEPSN